MYRMFAYNTAFNQDLSNWDVSNVTDMQVMFANSTFNRDLSNWCVQNVSSYDHFSSAMSNPPPFGTNDNCPFVAP